jgi:hypothetical protein
VGREVGRGMEADVTVAKGLPALNCDMHGARIYVWWFWKQCAVTNQHTWP